MLDAAPWCSDLLRTIQIGVGVDVDGALVGGAIARTSACSFVRAVSRGALVCVAEAAALAGFFATVLPRATCHCVASPSQGPGVRQEGNAEVQGTRQLS